jgi:hypothetical protein
LFSSLLATALLPDGNPGPKDLGLLLEAFYVIVPPTSSLREG